MTDFPTYLAQALLLMSHPAVVISLFVIGFVFHDKKTWGIAIMLTGFSMILNPALKEYFQLARPLGAEGYGFPSGHFQSATVFYGWIALNWPNTKVRAAIAVILAGIAYGLVFLGFHYIRDIAGALAVGSLVLLMSSLLIGRPYFNTKPPKYGIVLMGLSTLPLLYMYQSEGIPKHSWEGLACLFLSTTLWLLAFPYLKNRSSDT